MTSPTGSPRNLFDEAPCGLLLTRADGTIIEVNSTFCTWVSRAREQLIEQARFQDLLTVGCKIFHQTHWMPLLHMQGSVAEVQLDILHNDGRALPMLVNASKTQEGQISIATFVATDRRKYERELLQARRQAEQLLERERSTQSALLRTEAGLRLALNAAQLTVWNYQADSKELRYGPGSGKLIGRPELSEVDAELYRASIHPADLAGEQDAFQAAIDPSVRAPYQVEYRLRGHDRVERVVSSSGRAFFDDAGLLVAVSGVLQDVTEQRKAQHLLEERATLAEQLVGIVSHDLRTPLNAISLGATLLKGAALAEPQARVVARIEASASRANRLTSDLLDFTQARIGGGLRVKVRLTNVHQLVRDSLDEIRLARTGSLLEARELGSGAAQCDPDRLTQVLTNLVNNALVYGDPARPVTVSSGVVNGTLSLTVHNWGKAIPDSLLPHIFEPLRRGEHELSAGARSVGLGLYIVREIARAHGGDVTVASGPEEGTTFVVTIPQP